MTKITTSVTAFLLTACLLASAFADENSHWPGFRGPGGRGIATDQVTAESWDATNPDDEAIRWKIGVPGLGHGSPTIIDDKIFLATAVPANGKAPLDVGRNGNIDAANDNGEQTWWVLCYDKKTGKELWRKAARTGNPKATRHAKATHANTTIAADADHVVAFFGSEGLYCYDHDGNLLWQRDLGVINVSKYGIGWGYASSPAIHGDRIVLICDDPSDPYVVALRLSNGEELWRKSRQGDCERSWGTALIHTSDDNTQIVINGWPWIVSYHLETGDERWRIKGGGDNPIPSPFVYQDRIYITSAHGGPSPIFAIATTAKGNLSEPDSVAEQSVVWKLDRGGSYMSTPVAWGDYLYFGNTNGVVRCFHAETGKKIYEKRLGSGASIIASLVAADDKIYCPSENGKMYVLQAGPDFKILAKNEMEHPCFATPAISGGVLYVRTIENLMAIQAEYSEPSESTETEPTPKASPQTRPN